jgi:RNA polymerase sigma-70 factor (ECF subfamily)
LFEEFQSKTLGYLNGLLGDRGDAEDVQQEVWLSVYRNLSGLANPGAFRTWLFRITRHRALNWLRSTRRERELVVDTPVEEMDLPTGDVDARDAIDVDAIAGALNGLPPPQREVLLLRYQDDLSYTEIAMVIGTTVGTVRSRLHYAKRRLETLITNSQGENP